jgi:hypothetical protein
MHYHQYWRTQEHYHQGHLCRSSEQQVTPSINVCYDYKGIDTDTPKVMRPDRWPSDLRRGNTTTLMLLVVLRVVLMWCALISTTAATTGKFTILILNLQKINSDKNQ